MNLKYFFNSPEDAGKVAAHLYDCNLDGSIISYPREDRVAIKLAISLAGVTAKTLKQMTFPADERACANYDAPQIYVACLSAYTNGYHHGLWIDATQETEDIQNDIEWMLSWSPIAEEEKCEEWAIHCYENFESFSLGENENLEYVSKIAKALDSTESPEALASWLDYAKDQVNNPDIEKLVEDFHSYYCGHWDSERDFVLKCSEVHERYELSRFEEEFEFWSFHINWDTIATDLFIQDYHSKKASPYGIYVFNKYAE